MGGAQYQRVTGFQPVPSPNPGQNGKPILINCISYHPNHVKNFSLKEIRMLDYKDIKSGQLNVNQPGGGIGATNTGGAFGATP